MSMRTLQTIMAKRLISKNAFAATLLWLFPLFSKWQHILSFHYYSLKCRNVPIMNNYSTMLQKLLKCEVKAWLCWILIILQPLRFCVKSNFGQFKQSKNVIFGNLTRSSPKFTKIQSAKSLKLPKVTFLDCLNLLKFDFT